MQALLDKMTPEEKAEVESFATFLLTRRKPRQIKFLTDDITSQELLSLAEDAGSFEWLSAQGEDVYSIEDGEEAEWPRESSELPFYNIRNSQET